MGDKSAFIHLCRQESDLVCRLIALLDEERGALVTRNFTRLEALAEAKTQQLQLLTEKNRERQALLHTLGVTSVEATRQWVSDDAEASQVWVLLEDTLHKALVLNEFNGAQINAGLEFCQQGLSVLRTAAAAMMSYGPDGTQPDVELAGRKLGSA